MNNLVSFSKEEKDLATEATNAADELLEIWGHIFDDRSMPSDIEAARKHTAVLVEFGRMLESKLSPEVVDVTNPPEQTDEACDARLDSQSKSPHGNKGLMGLFHRFFG